MFRTTMCSSLGGQLY